MKKNDLIELLLAQDGAPAQSQPSGAVQGSAPAQSQPSGAAQGSTPAQSQPSGAVLQGGASAQSPSGGTVPSSTFVQNSSAGSAQGMSAAGGNGQAASRSGDTTAPRQRNIIRTPDRRENGTNRTRQGTYTSYTRRDGTSAARRDSSAVADRRESYTADTRTEQQERREPVQQERRAAVQEYERREPVQPERTEAVTDGQGDKLPVDLAQLDSGISVGGILEVMPDGYGFIRSDNYLPGENDVYVSPSQIRKFNLKTGDIITGNTRIKSQQEKFSALLYLKTINGMSPAEAMKRYNFEDMTPVFPNERMRMERGSRAIAMRIVDLFSPIGKGQRGMIVSPPKAGKTTLLKDVAKSILQNDPKMRLLILLIDERPEEVTDIKEAICGENVEVIYSTFDELPEHHKRVSEMVIERAKRLVEHNENVTILLDSITRLARAYNLTVPPSGRTLSGGLDPAALHMPKRFFGAARKMREGGSLTILATALVDTGSKMDDVVYEEFKGTGNMELVLDRKLSEKRVFPAIDIPKSGTRRDDLLLDREEQEAMEIMRRALNGMKSDEAVENILNMFVHTRDNRELVQKVRRQKFI
jgi:transcription termination factor Rho